MAACHEGAARQPPRVGDVLDRRQALDLLTGGILGDNEDLVPTEARSMAEAVFAPLGSDLVGRELFDVADAFDARAWVIVDGGGRFSVVIVYINDQ